MRSAKEMDLSGEVSALVLQIWATTRQAGPASFQDAALAIVRRWVPFGGALWGYATVEDTVLRGNAVHLLDLPPEIIAEYEAVKGFDRTARAAIRSPGTCMRFDERTPPVVKDPRMRAFNRKYGIDSVLSVMRVQEFSRLAMFVSLYRNHRSPKFTERERRIHEALVPHLAAAFDAVRLRSLERFSDRTRHGSSAAVADQDGRLHLAEEGFEQHLHEEWPSWQGPALPQPLAALVSGGGRHRGARVMVTVVPGAEGLTTLWARPIQPVDDLSQREAEISSAWAGGKSIAEIAATLGLSPTTIRNRIQDVYGKLDVHNRAGLIAALRI